MLRLLIFSALTSIFLAAPGLAGEPLSETGPAVAGRSRALDLRPDLSLSVREKAQRFVWREILHRENATFVKPHFVEVNLRAGDVLNLRTRSGRIVEEIRGRGPKDLGTFWGLSSFGDLLVLEFVYSRPYAYLPFRVDRVIEGNADLLAPLRPGREPESVCTPDDYDDVIILAPMFGIFNAGKPFEVIVCFSPWVAR